MWINLGKYNIDNKNMLLRLLRYSRVQSQKVVSEWEQSVVTMANNTDSKEESDAFLVFFDSFSERNKDESEHFSFSLAPQKIFEFK